MQWGHGLRTPREEIAFTLHGRKFNPSPKFLGTAEAYFVCHIGPIFRYLWFMPSLGVRSPWTKQIVSKTDWWHFIILYVDGTQSFYSDQLKSVFFYYYLFIGSWNNSICAYSIEYGRTYQYNGAHRDAISCMDWNKGI